MLLLQAVEAVATGAVRRAFANVRPPGHHAACSCISGFCFFNNVAIAARAAITKGLAKKVLIVDWDVRTLLVGSGCHEHVAGRW